MAVTDEERELIIKTALDPFLDWDREGTAHINEASYISILLHEADEQLELIVRTMSTHTVIAQFFVDAEEDTYDELHTVYQLIHWSNLFDDTEIEKIIKGKTKTAIEEIDKEMRALVINQLEALDSVIMWDVAYNMLEGTHPAGAKIIIDLPSCWTSVHEINGDSRTPPFYATQLTPFTVRTIKRNEHRKAQSVSVPEAQATHERLKKVFGLVREGDSRNDTADVESEGV